MTKVEICNLALYPLGGNAISSLTEGTKEANLCNDLYLNMLKVVISAHKWNFAKKEVSLAESATYTMLDERFEYAYQLPSGFIRMSRTSTRGTIYERRGEVLCTNETPFVIEYITLIEDVNLFPEMFAHAVAARLSVPMAQPLVRKGSPGAIELLKLYFAVLGEAKLEDSQNEKPYLDDSVVHTESSDTWLKSRA